MNRTERLLDLITYLLNAGEPVSWQQIKNHFSEDYARGVEESNQRKFERDKAELIALGIPIDYQSGSEFRREGYIIRKDRLFLPEIEFSPQESSLLLLAASAVLVNKSFPYREQLELALRKIIHEVTPPSPHISIDYSGRNRSASRSAWVHSIQDALERRKTIEIVYHAFSTGETKRRRVNPYGLIFRRGNWILIGWDHLRKAVRSFVLTRIEQEPKVNPKRPMTPDYAIPASFSLQTYQNQQPWEWESHEPLKVTLQVSPHRLFELLPDLSNAERTGEDTFCLRVTNKPGLISWVLAQKTDVKVLTPPEVQREICEVLRNLL